eukprot:3130853-Rhodomonas_salina.1
MKCMAFSRRFFASVKAYALWVGRSASDPADLAGCVLSGPESVRHLWSRSGRASLVRSTPHTGLRAQI